MAVALLSRYRNLVPLSVVHQTRGRTLSLPIRRALSSYADTSGAQLHRYTAFESPDLLALRYYGREDLLWVVLDANRRRLPEDFTPGEEIVLPSPGSATRVTRGGSR